MARDNGLKNKKNVFVYKTINSFLNLFIEYQGDKQFYYINKYNKNNTFFNDKLDILYVLKSHNLIYNNIDQAFNSINISKYDVIMSDLLSCQSIKNIILSMNNKSKINR